MKREATVCAECNAPLMRVLWHPTKKRPITASYCDNACKAAAQRKTKPVQEAWLRKVYEVEGKNCVEIARLVNRDPKQVWRWLRDFGLETRPRGSDLKRQWQEGVRVHCGGRPHSDEAKEKIRKKKIEAGRKPVLKDGKPYMLGRRGEAHHGWKGGQTPDRPKLARSDEWKEVVKAVWKRANAKCERCGEDHRRVDNRTKNGFHIHHIIPFRYKEYRADLSNLILLCRPCHTFVHSKRNTQRELIKCP